MFLFLILSMALLVYALIGLSLNDYQHNIILRNAIPHDGTRTVLIFFLWPFFYTFIVVYYVFRFLVVFTVAMIDIVVKVENGSLPTKDDEDAN